MAKKQKTTIDASDYDYGVLKVRGVDGKIIHSSGNGDAIHKATLLHFSKGGTVKQLIDANGLDINTKSGNAGTVRMSVGVSLRALVNNGTPVKVGSIKVEKLSQKVDLPKIEPKVAAKPKAKPKPKPKPKAKKAKVKKSAPRKRAAAPVEQPMAA